MLSILIENLMKCPCPDLFMKLNIGSVTQKSPVTADLIFIVIRSISSALLALVLFPFLLAVIMRLEMANSSPKSDRDRKY